jgi:hypothetical protein
MTEYTKPERQSLLKEPRPEFVDGAEGESVHMVCREVDRLRAEVARMSDENAALKSDLERVGEKYAQATDKWMRYEVEYILPSFGYAAEMGVDLRGLVLHAPGKNCVELLIEVLMMRLGHPGHPPRSRGTPDAAPDSTPGEE